MADAVRPFAYAARPMAYITRPTTALAENAALQPENLMRSAQNLTSPPGIGPIAAAPAFSRSARDHDRSAP